TASITVGDPLARFAAVIEVEHRGHRIHTQPVEMILFEPEERTAQEKVAYLIAPKVENLCSPIAMFPLARVRVFIGVRAVKEAQPVGIAREVRRNPIQDHADIMLVAVIDKVFKLIGVAKAAGGGEIA